jgi:hypothetical protein
MKWLQFKNFSKKKILRNWNFAQKFYNENTNSLGVQLHFGAIIQKPFFRYGEAGRTL